jgi:cytochrome c oxidase subunit 3
VVAAVVVSWCDMPGWVGVTTVLAWRGRFSADYHTPVEIVGLFWHFVDIVWVFLFPLLYLVG